MGEDANPPKEKTVQKATEASAHADEAVESIANQVLQFYFNLLAEEARRPWNKILGKKLTAPHGSTDSELNMPKASEVMVFLHGLWNLSPLNSLPE
jgi:hypothetical protein